jgi:hypothetical protein
MVCPAQLLQLPSDLISGHNNSSLQSFLQQGSTTARLLTDRTVCMLTGTATFGSAEVTRQGLKRNQAAHSVNSDVLHVTLP